MLLDQLGGIHAEGLSQFAACFRPWLGVVALDARKCGDGDSYFLRQLLLRERALVSQPPDLVAHVNHHLYATKLLYSSLISTNIVQ